MTTSGPTVVTVPRVNGKGAVLSIVNASDGPSADAILLPIDSAIFGPTVIVKSPSPAIPKIVNV